MVRMVPSSFVRAGSAFECFAAFLFTLYTRCNLREALSGVLGWHTAGRWSVRFQTCGTPPGARAPQAWSRAGWSGSRRRRRRPAPAPSPRATRCTPLSTLAAWCAWSQAYTGSEAAHCKLLALQPSGARATAATPRSSPAARSSWTGARARTSPVRQGTAAPSPTRWRASTQACSPCGSCGSRECVPRGEAWRALRSTSRSRTAASPSTARRPAGLPPRETTRSRSVGRR